MNWEDISIGQYTDIVKVVEKHNKASEPDEITYVMDLLSVCTGKSKEEFMGMTVDELKLLTNELSFISQPPKGRLNDKIIVNDKKYNLTVNVKNITIAQYIDYTETLKKDPENIAMMCAIFCIPDGHKYNEGYHVVDLADEFYDHFKIVDAIGISFFFQKLYQTSVKVTLNYLKRRLKKEMKKAAKKKEYPEVIQKIKESIEALEAAGGLI